MPSYIGPQLSLIGRGLKLCLCRCTSLPTNKGLLGLNRREEAVLDLEISLRGHNDGDSEILNGPIEER